MILLLNIEIFDIQRVLTWLYSQWPSPKIHGACAIAAICDVTIGFIWKIWKRDSPNFFSFHSIPKNMTRWYGEVPMGQKSQKSPLNPSPTQTTHPPGRVSRLEGGQAESGGMGGFPPEAELIQKVRESHGNSVISRKSWGRSNTYWRNTVNFSKLLMLMMLSVGFDECFRIGSSSINWDVYEPLVWILPRRYHEEFLGFVWTCCLMIKGGYTTWLHRDYELTHNGIGTYNSSMTGLEVHKLLDQPINTWNMSLCVCATARKVIFEAELKSVVQFLKLQKHKQKLVNQSFFLFFFTFFWPRSVFQRFFHVFGEDPCGIPGTKQCLPRDTAGVAGLDLPPDVPDGAAPMGIGLGKSKISGERMSRVLSGKLT